MRDSATMKGMHKKTPIPRGLLEDREFLREVRILLDSCAPSPVTVSRAWEAALEIVGPCEKVPAGGVEVVPMKSGKFLGKLEMGKDVSGAIVVRDQRNVQKPKGRELVAGCSESE